MERRTPLWVLLVLAILGSGCLAAGGTCWLAHNQPRATQRLIPPEMTKRYIVEWRERDTGIRRQRETSRALELATVLLWAGGLMVAAAILEETLRKREIWVKKRGDGKPSGDWG